MPAISHWFVDSFRDKNGVLNSSKYVYGCRYRDRYLLHDPASLPRYGHLARKLFLHYAGEHYNPNTISTAIEADVRRYIKELIEYRIMHRTKGYDWEWIDHFFKKLVGSYYDLNLTYSQQRIDEGFAPACKGLFPMDYKRPN